MRGYTAVLGILLLLCITQARKRYDGYKVIEVIPTEKSHLLSLREIEESDNELDFWVNSRLIGKAVYIMVPPHRFASFMMRLYSEGMTPTIHNDNVQRKLDIDLARRNEAPRAFNIDDFNRYEDIMTEVDSMANRCPSGVTCRSYVISPKSVEGRDLKVLSMTTSPGQTNKTAFWMDATIHAREWLATATVLKVMTNFVDNYTSDANVKNLLDKYDWFFLPVVNPDGYVYSWDEDRFWRKSRNINAADPDCVGTDLNRNFDTGNWCSQGVSTDPCSNIYCGSGAASEPETQAVQTELKKHAPRIRAFVTVHTAAQMILFPWGFADESGTCERTDNHDKMNAVAEAFANAIENTWNTLWQRGTGCETLYATTGTSRDYAKAPSPGAGIEYSFTPELRGPGFDPPASEIPVSYAEFWNGLKAMVAETEKP